MKVSSASGPDEEHNTQERSAMFRSLTSSPSFAAVLAAWVAVAFVVLLLCIGKPSFAAESSSLQDAAEIRQLTICYALGTDAIGAGDVDKGKALYTDCFTDDAPIAAFFPNGQGTKRTGPDAWADFVKEIFRENKYTATQHLIGTIDVNIDHKTGDAANMTSYLHATHLLPNGSINVANGTYEDEVVKTGTGWRIRKRTLKLVTFLNLNSPSSAEK